jgi:hypothetical protein
MASPGNGSGKLRSHSECAGATEGGTARLVAINGPLNENIENDPMQSSMVRPFERFRKNILTRRANHRRIFIVARTKPAPENPPRAF